MKEILDSILNSKKKTVKIIGTIVGNPEYLRYIISTDTGKMQVESTTPYKIGDRVVVFDRVIQGYAGIEKSRKTFLV